MALISYYADDMDGTQGEDVKTRVIPLGDGVLKLDLSDDNYAKVVKALTDAAKRVVKADTFSKFYAEGVSADKSENAIIREWARAQRNSDGSPRFEVNVKGRVAEDIVNAYRAFQASEHKSDAQANANADASAESVKQLVNG